MTGRQQRTAQAIARDAEAPAGTLTTTALTARSPFGVVSTSNSTTVRAYPISTRVNSVKNDDAGLLEPMMAEGGVAV